MPSRTGGAVRCPDRSAPRGGGIPFNFRFSTASTAEGLMDAMNEILDSHGLDYEIDWHLSGKPFLTPRGPLCDTLSEAIREVTGLTPELSTSGGTSDGRFIAGV